MGLAGQTNIVHAYLHTLFCMLGHAGLLQLVTCLDFGSVKVHLWLSDFHYVVYARML